MKTYTLKSGDKTYSGLSYETARTLSEDIYRRTYSHCTITLEMDANRLYTFKNRPCLKCGCINYVRFDGSQGKDGDVSGYECYHCGKDFITDKEADTIFHAAPAIYTFNNPAAEEEGQTFLMVEDRDDRALFQSLSPAFVDWPVKPTFLYPKADMKRIEE